MPSRTAAAGNDDIVIHLKDGACRTGRYPKARMSANWHGPMIYGPMMHGPMMQER